MVQCTNCGFEIAGEARFCPQCGTQVVVEPGSDPLIGRTLNGKYRIAEKLGEGSMGSVYLSEHIGLQKRVALKVLHSDLLVGADAVQRFRREGIAAGKFSHPNAIQIFDFDEADGSVFFLAMEFIEGPNLKEFLARNGPLEVPRAIEVIRQVLLALAEAHTHGIVHRDLKPENIMILEGSGGQLTVKVLDFGLSKLINRPVGASLQTMPGVIMGTPLYMAPEQAGGEEVDARSDLYAVGLILYELMAGSSPYAGESFTEIMIKQATEMPPPLAEARPGLRVPADLDAILQTSLAKLKDDRFQSCAEMLTALDQVDLDGPEARAVVPPRAQPRAAADATGGGKRKSAPLLIGAAVAVALVGLWFVLPAGSSSEAFARVSEKETSALSDEERAYLDLLDSTRSYIRTGDSDAALSALRDAERMACSDSEAYLLRAQVFSSRSDFDTARADLQEALRVDPAYAEAKAAVGWLELRAGEHAAASEHFEAALADDEACASALAGRGALAFEAGEFESALELLSGACELAPRAARPQLYLGRTYLELGEPVKAVDPLIEAKRNDHRSAEAYAYLGQAYLAVDRLEDAEVQLEEARRHDRDAEAPQVGLASLWIGQSRYNEAVLLLETALERAPGRIQLLSLLGAAYDGAGRTAEAISTLERIPPEQRDAPTHALLGTLYHLDGRLEDALDAYANGTEMERDLNVGLVLMQLGRASESVEHFERSLASGETATAHYALGILFMEYLGDPGRARTHFEEYRQLGGNDNRVSDWLQRL